MKKISTAAAKPSRKISEQKLTADWTWAIWFLNAGMRDMVAIVQFAEGIPAALLKAIRAKRRSAVNA